MLSSIQLKFGVFVLCQTRMASMNFGDSRFFSFFKVTEEFFLCIMVYLLNSLECTNAAVDLTQIYWNIIQFFTGIRQ